jgi:hypothetical protein
LEPNPCNALYLKRQSRALVKVGRNILSECLGKPVSGATVLNLLVSSQCAQEVPSNRREAMQLIFMPLIWLGLGRPATHIIY